MIAAALAIACGMGPAAAQPDETWLAVTDTDLRVQPGSALDFSAQFGPAAKPAAAGIPAGARYFCAVIPLTGSTGGLPDHARADALVTELRRAGYNLARLHYVDRALMPQGKRDFDFQADMAERYHYLVASLDHAGISWMADLASAHAGGAAGSAFNEAAPYLQYGMYVDPAQRANWQRLAAEVMDAPTTPPAPSLSHDPGLLAVTMANENTLGYVAGYESVHRFHARWSTYPDALQQAFDAWSAHPGLTPAFGGDPAARTWPRFTAEAEHDSAARMAAFVRARGYAGLLTAFNNHTDMAEWAERSQLDLVSFHAYFDHPLNFTAPGAGQTAASDVGAGLPLIRLLAAARIHGRPYLVDEYDHPYWSPRRHEANLAVPAYAAFQGWNGVCRYANPVVLTYAPGDASVPDRERAITPFAIGMDPVARAGERLAALLYRRGDVAPAAARATILLDPATVFAARRTSFLADWLTRIALVTGFDTAWNTAPGAATIPLGDGLARPADPQTVQLNPDNDDRWSAMLHQLRARHLLPNANPSNADSYVSSTGEIMLTPSRRELRVITPRTEAISFDQPGAFTLRQLAFSADTPATVSLSSLDGQKLGTSRHMLAILATDAINTGAAFSPNRTTLRALGTLPVRLRAIDATLTIALDSAAPVRAYALALNGARREELAVRRNGAAATLRIDLAALRQGPTPYVEIVQSSP